MRPDEITRALGALFARRLPIDAIDAGLALFRGDALLDAIEGILRSDASKLAAASYAHPNGFAKLVLATDERFKLRLHSWPAGERRASDVHDHRWDFGTRILQGGYSFEEHAFVPGARWHRYRYFSPEGGSNFLLEPRERCDTVCIRRGRVHAGTEYTLPADVLHRVRPHGDGPTLTLFLQGPVVRPWTNVLSRRALRAQARLEVALEGTTLDAYRAHLRAIAARLERRRVAA